MTLQQPSICIPRLMDVTINKALIQSVFDKYNLGNIARIDIVNKHGNLRAFIHFNYWHKTEYVLDIKNRLLNGETLNIIYKKPWFWKCSASRIKYS